MPAPAPDSTVGLSAIGVAPGPRPRPLRLLMVLESDFTPRGGGGAESQVRTLALHLLRMGQQVTVVTPLLARGRQVTAERCARIPVGRIRYPQVPTLGAAVMSLRFGAFLLGHGRRYDAWHVHIGHHLYPSVPFYNLRELQRLLMLNPDYAGRAHVTKGYIAFVIELLGADSKRIERRAQVH